MKTMRDCRSMELRLDDHDIHVFKIGEKIDGVRPFFFNSPITGFRREPDESFEVIVLEFENGGEVRITTEKPLVWIEPERM